MALDLTLKGPNALFQRLSDDTPFDLSVRAPGAATPLNLSRHTHQGSRPLSPNPGSQVKQPSKLHIPKPIKAQPLWDPMAPYPQDLLRLRAPQPKRSLTPLVSTQQLSDLRLGLPGSSGSYGSSGSSCSPIRGNTSSSPPKYPKRHDLLHRRGQIHGHLVPRPPHLLYPQPHFQPEHHPRHLQRQRLHHQSHFQRHPYLGVFKEISPRARVHPSPKPEVFFECEFGADGQLKVERREGLRSPSHPSNIIKKSLPPPPSLLK